MKQLLCTTLVGLATLTGVGSPLQAGTFGLFVGHCCCDKCGCGVCIRQYNAFTPIVCGQLPGCRGGPSCGGYGPDCGAGCGPVGIIGQTCAIPGNEPAQMAAQYQMYQNRLAAQLALSYQYMNTWHPDANARFQVTGYMPSQGYHLPSQMVQGEEPSVPVEVAP